MASNIRRAQETSGMSGREVADQLGVTPDQFSKWRRGEVMPSLPYLAQLAEVLADGDIAYFYADLDEVPA